jgi:hypothetical protein
VRETFEQSIDRVLVEVARQLIEALESRAPAKPMHDFGVPQAALAPKLRMMGNQPRARNGVAGVARAREVLYVIAAAIGIFEMRRFRPGAALSSFGHGSLHGQLAAAELRDQPV